VSSEGGRRPSLPLWQWVVIAIVVLLALIYVATQLLTAD
jgi:hypothetical protein